MQYCGLKPIWLKHFRFQTPPSKKNCSRDEEWGSILYANSKRRPILVNRIIATTAVYSEYKHKQMFYTDFTGALIKYQQTNFTFEISYSPQKKYNCHFAVIFYSKHIKLIFHEWTRLAQQYSYIKHHNTKHNDSITDNTKSMFTKRRLSQGHVLFSTPKFPSGRFF